MSSGGSIEICSTLAAQKKSYGNGFAPRCTIAERTTECSLDMDQRLRHLAQSGNERVSLWSVVFLIVESRRKLSTIEAPKQSST